MFNRLLISLFVLTLSACAPALEAYEMTPKSALYDTVQTSNSLNKKIAIGSVVTEKNMGGAVAPVTSEQYKDAIVLALRQTGWYNTTSPKLRLDAHLLDIEQPFMGFSFTVKAKSQYTLTDSKTGKVWYRDTIIVPCTVTMSEAFEGAVRMRKATACAVAENITHFIKVLSQRY